MGSESATGFAPGKLILSGEHSVVYGFPAIAIAVDRGTRVTLHRRPGPTSVERSVIRDARLDKALGTLLPSSGIGVEIDSDLPVGRGMGSSAALAVALVRARAALEGRVADFDECHREGFAVERVFHGTPSGLDHAVSARGGGVRYRRADGEVHIEPLSLPALRLVVLDTEVAGNTAELVAGVRSRRPSIDPLLDRMGELTDQIASRLAAGNADIGGLLDWNHSLLRQIGVSNERVDSLTRLARVSGARGAKLSGAGGGGIVIALVDDPEPVLSAARVRGVPAFSVGICPPHAPEEHP